MPARNAIADGFWSSTASLTYLPGKTRVRSFFVRKNLSCLPCDSSVLYAVFLLKQLKNNRAFRRGAGIITVNFPSQFPAILTATNCITIPSSLLAGGTPSSIVMPENHGFYAEEAEFL
jgi:hypothetical protein